jgi:hypothetical protein
MDSMDPSLPTERTAAAYWKAVATITSDRRRALGDLERFFAAGTVPESLDGFHRGRLIATTLGHGLDFVWESLARLWMPWKGKTFDDGTNSGWNVFASGGRFVARLIWPRYRGIEPFSPGLDTAFRFVTSAGSSATVQGSSVLRIDYDLQDNPEWPIRRVLDELVRVDEGLFLGQALFRLGAQWRRAAWFSLEA